MVERPRTIFVVLDSVAHQPIAAFDTLANAEATLRTTYSAFPDARLDLMGEAKNGQRRFYQIHGHAFIVDEVTLFTEPDHL